MALVTKKSREFQAAPKERTYKPTEAELKALERVKPRLPRAISLLWPNFSMTWNVAVAGPARKQIAKFPARDQLRIKTAIRSMADDPFSGDTLKLEGSANQWRRRVGSYRLMFTVFPDRTILVSAIVRRTSTTY